jgi:hypothetical protein
MTAVTFSPALTPAAKATAKPAAKSQNGFWTRVWDRIVEARMRQVEREIRMHLNYIPTKTLEEAGYFSSLSNDRDLPFVK